jgi:hypothetical protein
MKTGAKILVWICLVTIPSSIHAQKGPGNDDPDITSNLGFTIGAPLNPTARYVSAGWGLDAGAGYNFDRRNAVIGEFMWNWLTATNGALQPIRVALQSPNIDGHAELYALTANYRYELRGRKFGTYFIGGGGWYHRWTDLTKSTPTGSGITCDRAWLWWGYACSSGAVTANQVVGTSGENAFGLNGGIGFTIRVGEAPYRFYAESRYHYAPTKNINTQLISVTVGLRY